MKVYEALRHCIVELKRVGGDRHLIREAEMAIEMARLKASAASGCRRGPPFGRRPMALPFEDIHAERKRRLTWKEIRYRLDAAGFHISKRKLMARYAQWKTQQVQRHSSEQLVARPDFTTANGDDQLAGR